MVHGVKRRADMLQDLVIRGDVGAREILVPDIEVLAQRVRLENRPRALEGGNRDLLVRLADEPVRVDDGLHRGVRGRDGDVTTGDGGDEGGGKRRVLVPVDGGALDVVLLDPEIRAYGEILDFRPVRRELREVVLDLLGEVAAEVGGDFFVAGEVAAGACKDATLLRVEELDCFRSAAEGEGAGRLDVDAVGGAEEDVVPQVLADAGEVF